MRGCPTQGLSLAPGTMRLGQPRVGQHHGQHAHQALLNGQPIDYVEKAEAEAKRVREKLMGVTRRHALWVQSSLVFMKPKLRVKFQPRNVAALTDEMLLPFLRQKPQKLGPYELEELVQAAQREETWE
ncbi:hypothetical protein DAT35_17040 [Vitiosangium sp. GDMCC 1.1324]|nr:hypothetical protein DAT35_17040 [Vitiosangium sp. GDMCC 1.1324]